MKSTKKHHGIMSDFIIFLVLFPQIINLVGAQMEAPPPGNNFMNSPARFTPAMGVILIILIGGFLFMSFYSIYIRNCSPHSSDNDNNNNNNVPRVGSLRTRRGAARGLEASVIETFPIFSYSEVKDHQIGKGALECAVCLNEFEDEETLRLLPKCDHVFHPECIDAWLGSHVTCPVCRADLVPKPDDKPVLVAVNTDNNDDVVERSGSRNGEVILQVDREEPSQETRVKRNLSFDYANRLRKSLSIKKFRSHSTGHSLVQPGENVERFTLRLPAQVRKDVIHRATLNRARSCAIVLPREGSLRSGYRRDGSTRNGRLYQNIEQWSDRRAKSVQWNFLTRGFSKKSSKMGVETDQESTSNSNEIRTPKKMPSFKCLEPKAVDEVSLFSNVN